MKGKCKSCTMSEIAAKLGISKTAVSLALRNSTRISPKTKSKVRMQAKRMGYAVSPLVSTLMSNMRTSKARDNLETIVLINANRERNILQKYPIFSKYAEGVKSEAAMLGYSVYEVWLYEPGLSAEKLMRVMHSRGIRGGVVLGNTDSCKLPQKFAQIWKSFIFVSAGTRTSNPVLDFVSADKFLIARHATLEVIRSGYRRPALILDKGIDNLVEGRFTGGFLCAQMSLDESDRIPPMLNVKSLISKSGFFDRWLKKYRPDAILSISNATADKLIESGIKFPENIPMIAFERNIDGKIWKGMDKNYDKVGRLAVDRLFDLLNRPAYFKSAEVSTGTIVVPDWEKMR